MCKSPPQAPTLVVSAATAVKVYIMLVVPLVVAGPRAVDRLPLNLNLPDSAFALATDLIRKLNQVQYVLLHRVSVVHVTRAGLPTYISKVLHHVEEVVRLFACVPHRVDGFSDDQVLGDFGPHVLLALLDNSLVVTVSVMFVISATNDACHDVPP